MQKNRTGMLAVEVVLLTGLVALAGLLCYLFITTTEEDKVKDRNEFLTLVGFINGKQVAQAGVTDPEFKLDIFKDKKEVKVNFPDGTPQVAQEDSNKNLKIEIEKLKGALNTIEKRGNTLITDKVQKLIVKHLPKNTSHVSDMGNGWYMFRSNYLNIDGTPHTATFMVYFMFVGEGDNIKAIPSAFTLVDK